MEIEQLEELVRKSGKVVKREGERVQSWSRFEKKCAHVKEKYGVDSGRSVWKSRPDDGLTTGVRMEKKNTIGQVLS